jgi:hypothetical protein
MRPNRLRLPPERFIGDSALSLESPGLHGIEVLKRPYVMWGWQYRQARGEHRRPEHAIASMLGCNRVIMVQ